MRNGEEAPERVAVAVVVTAQDLQALLAAERSKQAASEARERELLEPAAHASRDSQELGSGLPRLLAGRSQELSRQMEGVESLSASARTSSLEIDALREECQKLLEEVKSLTENVEAWPVLVAPLQTENRVAGTSIRAIDEQRSSTQKAAKDLQTGAYLGTEGTSLVERLQSRDIPLLTSEAAHQEAVLADLRRQHAAGLLDRQERAEAAWLASELELRGLHRSLTLRTEKLRAKEREATWWKAKELLSRQLEVESQKQQREHAARIARPLQTSLHLEERSAYASEVLGGVGRTAQPDRANLQNMPNANSFPSTGSWLPAKIERSHAAG
ncbi:unnamed protein product [Polarella glacialis]|uniref:Uncharacterized protein n=1 Tax=Polarella glacialis TaxID=89957 RepID=A0A813FNX1_POLGL|nr:unnamed protein product [Polarella glacialis]